MPEKWAEDLYDYAAVAIVTRAEATKPYKTDPLHPTTLQSTLVRARVGGKGEGRGGRQARGRRAGRRKRRIP